MGFDETTGRELFVVDVRSVDELLEVAVDVAGAHVALIAWDAVAESPKTLIRVATHLLDRGCVYICCWGPGCVRVHDAFDEVDIARRPDGPIVMSTWHADESLAEAVSFTLFSTSPDEAFDADDLSTVAISVGCSEWATELRAAMRDPRQLEGAGD